MSKAENFWKGFKSSKTISDYDTVADKVVMKNEELQKVLTDSISKDKNEKFYLLDLGCGTGHTSLEIIKKFPNVQITAIDFSREMINLSRKNLRDFSDKVELIEADFTKTEFTRKYDYVVSAITIHNVDHKQKEKLFKKIFSVLKEDGSFINADFIEGENKEIDAEYRKKYRDHLEKNLSGEELQVWLKHAFEEDTPMKLSEQFKILRKIGFRKIEHIWQHNNEAIYTALK